MIDRALRANQPLIGTAYTGEEVVAGLLFSSILPGYFTIYRMHISRLSRI